MATGYTDNVRTGKVTALSDYAAECARAFGAFMHQRDDESGVELRMPERNNFYSKQYHISYLERRKWNESSEEEKYAQWSAYCNDLINSAIQRRTRATVEKARYEGMLEQVEQVDVSEDLIEFKKFMIEQLTSSIDFDCGEWKFKETEIPLGYVEYCEYTKQKLEESLVRYREAAQEEEMRNQKRIDYIQAMSSTFGFKVRS